MRSRTSAVSLGPVSLRPRSAEDLVFARNSAGGATVVLGGCMAFGIAVGGPVWLKVAVPTLAILSGVVVLILHVAERRARVREQQQLVIGAPVVTGALVVGEQGSRGVIADLRPREGPVVFVSASAEDEDWRRRLVSVLAPLLDGRDLGVWSEEPSAPAPTTDERWAAIRRAQAVLVLVSKSYLASERLLVSRAIVFGTVVCLGRVFSRSKEKGHGSPPDVQRAGQAADRAVVAARRVQRG